MRDLLKFVDFGSFFYIVTGFSFFFLIHGETANLVLSFLTAPSVNYEKFNLCLNVSENWFCIYFSPMTSKSININTQRENAKCDKNE